MIFKLFGLKPTEEQKTVKVKGDPFPKAIESLNKLITFFQEYERSHDNPVTIELSRFWNKTQLNGSEVFGIEGELTLKNLKGSIYNLDLLKALNELGFTHTSIYNSFSESFFLYHLPFIERIPEKVDSIIAEYQEYQEFLDNQIAGLS